MKERPTTVRIGIWLRALRPLLWWLLLVAVLYGIRVHQRLMRDTRIEFSLKFDGQSSLPSANVTLDGQPIVSGQNIPLGNHTFAIASPKTDPVRIQFFAWYGLHPLGDINLKRSFGNLHIHAEPTPVKMTVSGPEVSVTLWDVGDTNMSLPTDAYVLIAEYPHGSQSQDVTVYSDQTALSTFMLKFGAARIETVPEGASVNGSDGSYLGHTPLDLADLPVQTTSFTLSLAEYKPVSLVMNISGGVTNVCLTNLLSIRFESALQGARASLAIQDYQAAAKKAAEALAFEPSDVDALAIQKAAREALAEQQKQHEAEAERAAQLKRPREVFEALCGKNSDAALFTEHELKTGKAAKDIDEAIAKSFQNGSPAFQIQDNSLTEKDTYQIVAKHDRSLGILGGSERLCLVVVGRTRDDETEILYKVVEYQIRNSMLTEGFAIHDHKELIPVAPSKIQINDLLAAQVRDGMKMVAGRINEAIEKP